MYDWPPLTVCIITYNRPVILRRTLQSLVEHICYPNLFLHLADDGSKPAYAADVLKEFSSHFQGTSLTVTRRKGWGVNANTALRYISSHSGSLVYFQEDDYLLARDLDLRPGVLLLGAREEIGMVRYRGISGHRIVASLQEFNLPKGSSPSGGQLRQALSLPGRFCYWDLDQSSSELYVYTNGPHLKDVVRFHGVYGFYREGRKLGATEEEFAHRVKDGTYPVRIAMFPEWVLMHYDDIGHSYQLTEEDIGT